MPRPKVHPSQRRRAAQACAFCRNSKKRCSGSSPCTNCKARGIESQCSLKASPNGYGAQQCDQRDDIGQESHARMLLNLRGERVYLGEAASLSFLGFVRETVTSQLGPSAFTQNERTDSMFETEPLLVDSVDVTLNKDEIDAYLMIFEAASGAFIDTFTEDEISTANIESPSIAMAVAIGAQCKSHDAVAIMYFRKAQRQAFASMLQDPDLEMVRLFLLMSFYLLGACRRNTAFMYLGIAARAAVSLGLHSEFGQSNCIRLKTWMSLCVLDMLVSSILGRPPATSHLRSSIDPVVQNATGQLSESLVASYEILSIVDDGIDKLYKDKQMSPAMVEDFMSRMKTWSSALPGNLRRCADTKGTISNIYVSCLYYFGVTVITRPVLIVSLNSQEPSELATACLDAAVLLIQTCAEAKTAGILLGNMCILKALVFAAGLIVGFDIFAKKETDYETETAFRSAREVLNFLALQSPQAAHYADILSSLEKAIMQRRGVMPRDKPKLVERIFTVATKSDNSLTEGELPNDDFGWELPSFPDVNWDSFDLLQWDNFPFPSPR